MSDKKRIEAIKGVFLGQVYNINKAVTFDREDADWLIQQAERVQELERIAQKSGELNVFLQGRMKGRWGDNVIDIAMDLIAEQEKENVPLRKALEFYADSNNYSQRMSEPFVFYRPISKDNGDRARRALKGESK